MSESRYFELIDFLENTGQALELKQHFHSKGGGRSASRWVVDRGASDTAGSYEAQLAQARAKRAMDKSNALAVPSPALKGNMPEGMGDAVSAAQKLPTGSPSPLSPEVQGHVATLLSLLGQRLNSETPLSPDQLQHFAAAAAEVLADAKSPPGQEEPQVTMYKGGQPVFFMGHHETKPSAEQAPVAAQTTSTTADAVSRYMRGSTYYVEGMEEMTPEQYTSALNAKIANAMTERRMRGGSYGNEAAWDYMRSLNQHKQQQMQATASRWRTAPVAQPRFT